MTTLATILFALLAALQIGDWITTARVLRRPGGRERNPLVRWLMERISLHPALALKAGLVTAIGWVLAAVATPPAIAHGLLAALCAFYAWVCFHNWRLVR